MPSSVDGVYYRDGRFIDFFNNPINFNALNTDTGEGNSSGSSFFGSLGPTGATGATGQDLLFVPGGTGTVERILPDVFLATEANEPLVYDIYLYSLFSKDKQIVKFTSYQNTEDGTGYFNACSIRFEEISTSGVSTMHTLFTANNDSNIQGLFPAKIKFDKDPNTSPSGYSTLEKINLIQSDFEISRIGSVVYFQAKIYGLNPSEQVSFGRSKFVQKTWILNSGFLLNTKSIIQFSIAPDGFGTSLGIRNILRYNAY
jgi:hypothetical protein